MNILQTAVAYGKSIESNFPFDALPRIQAATQPLQIAVTRVSLIERETGTTFRTGHAQGREIHIIFRQPCTIVQIDLMLSVQIDLAAERVTCFALESLSDETIRYWVLQHILPIYLIIQGSMEFFHGSAVSAFPVGDADGIPVTRKAITFLGESYVGKSTLLQHFLQRDHALFTDDQLPISREDYTKVYPALPYYRPYRAREDLGLVAARYSPEPASLERIYLLRASAAHQPVKIERVDGVTAVTSLYHFLPYTLYNAKKPDFFPLVEDRFRGLADIARKVPMSYLHVPRDLRRLPEVYDYVQADLSTGITQ